MKILHITDLHLNDFEKGEEFLRKGFYQEYIERLYQSINNSIDDFKLDCLIVTGDFIDRGITENYEHVKIIIDYLVKIFNISRTSVFTTIGNHDYAWKNLEKLDIEKEKLLKNDYIRFRDSYSSGFLNDEGFYSIEKIDDSTYFISLDSTWNSENGNPGQLSTLEIDSIISSLKEIASEQTTFLIGCHFPIISYDDNFLAGEETNWHENHIWLKANILRDRIKRLNVKNIIWFHGDVHAGDARVIDKETFILTSKFGCKPGDSEQKRQANLITIDQASISRITCNYEFPAHQENLSLGDWKLSSQTKIRTFKVIETKRDNVLEEQLLPIDKEIEEVIIRKIKDKKLYQFGRFPVSDNKVSLGWIDISKLLNDKELLNRISDKCYDEIKLKKINYSESLFLGVEIIGGILASQLSIRFNIKNSVIPIRANEDRYSEFEFSRFSSHELKKYKDIFIFIDIISSGNTILDLIKEILSENSDLNIYVIAIISNDIEGKLFKIAGTQSYQVFCTNLKIPVIKESEMPDQEFIIPNCM